MLYGQDRVHMRRNFVVAWRKRLAGLPLEPLEKEIGDVIAMHPEYHALMEQDDTLDRDFCVEGDAQNPFLHLGLHIALHEQVSTDRPAGVRALFAQLVPRGTRAHEIEHAMMECLQSALYEAQSNGCPPDERRYLACLRRIERSKSSKIGTVKFRGVLRR